MNSLLFDLSVVLLFIIVGGLFAAAEASLNSLRETQLRGLVKSGGRRARWLTRLVADPDTYQTSVRIGIMLTTMLSAAFGAATVSGRVSSYLVAEGVSDRIAIPLALVVLTVALSFVSLVLAELAPKRLAVQAAERIALNAAGPLILLANIFRPFVWFLGKASAGIVRIFGGDPEAQLDELSADELQSIVQGHEALSTFERRMIRDVFAADDTSVREVMVPRLQVVLLQSSLSVGRAAKLALQHPHSRFPVMGRDSDDVVGLVHIRELLSPTHPLGRAASVGDLAKPILHIPGTKRVLDAMQEMRLEGHHLAVVVDEYGGTDGIITLEDLIEEIVGEMTAPGVVPGLHAESSVGGINGPVVTDGGLNLDDFFEVSGVELPSGPYQTVAGFVIDRLGRIPVLADFCDHDGYRYTVTAIQGRRVAAVTVEPISS